MYNAYITRLKNLRPHPNADRLQLGDCFGNTVCVSLDYEDNQLGVYFPTDGQLSFEFAEKNNLLRKKDSSGNNIGGYMDADKRNVTAIRLRGEKSDGLFLPLSCLSDFGDISQLKEGDIVSTFNGHEIACKYIPRTNRRSSNYNSGNKTRKKKVPIAPLFAEHADTEQLAYNLNAFKVGDEIEITLKMHGTSQRTGYLPMLMPNVYEFNSAIKALICKMIIGKKLKNWFGEKFGKVHYEYNYVSGTRRTVLENFEGGFYGDNHFRQQHHDKFVGKLMKGETVYYEVVGFTDSGAPIMGNGKNDKLGKDFVKQYGKETVFSYGCAPDGLAYKEASYATAVDGSNVDTLQPVSQSECYVYRMTMTNEDGFVVEYSPDFMRYRCEQIGVKCVPVFEHCFVPNAPHSEYEEITGFNFTGEFVKKLAERYYDGADPIGKTHVREGVVVRILNRPKFTAFKHKNFSFKVLEGIIKDTSSAPDMEEAQEVTGEV